MYYGWRLLRICSQSQLLGLEALKAHAQLANHTLCMVVVLLLHSGEVGNFHTSREAATPLQTQTRLLRAASLGASSGSCRNAMCLAQQLLLSPCPRVWGICRYPYQLLSPQWRSLPTCTRSTECAPSLDDTLQILRALAGYLPRLRLLRMLTDRSVACAFCAACFVCCCLAS